MLQQGSLPISDRRSLLCSSHIIHHSTRPKHSLSLLAQGIQVELLWDLEYLSTILFKEIRTAEEEVLEEGTMTDNAPLKINLSRNTLFLGAHLGYS